jgi:hypothetical protein
MKRTMALPAIVGVVILIMAAFVFAEEPAWFDMEKCEFCRHLTKDPNLMENMTWKHYEISNGLLVVTTVKPEYKESYNKAVAAMQKLGQEMMAGTKTDVVTCGHCQYYGKMMEAGAKFESVKTDWGDIDLITTDNPETLTMIRQYAKNNDEAMAAMEAEKKKSTQ